VLASDALLSIVSLLRKELKIFHGSLTIAREDPGDATTVIETRILRFKFNGFVASLLYVSSSGIPP